MWLNGYGFRRAATADLTTIARWIETPAVAEWWIEADGRPAPPVDVEDLGDPAMSIWIVEHGDTPFAYLQDYDPHAWPGHHFAHLPQGSRGIDQFIGVPEMLGLGHGSAFIRAYAETLFTRGVPAIGTDPHPANARAIRAYEKAGFGRRDETDTPWGRCLLMERVASAGRTVGASG